MLTYLFGRLIMIEFLRNIWHFFKDRPILIPIAIFVLTVIIGICRMVIRRIIKHIIECKATKIGASLLLEIAKEFHKTKKLEIKRKGPQFIYDDLMELKEIKPEETLYKQQSFEFHFNRIEKIYHPILITRILGIDEQIKERCFEKLLETGKLHEGKEKHTFIFRKDDNLDLLDKDAERVDRERKKRSKNRG